MAHAIESRATTPANDLRDALDQAERQVVNLDASNVEEFLALLDRIEQHFETFAHSKIDVRPEEVRWESLLNRINTDPRPLVNAANQAGGLAGLSAKHPPAESFWWQLDAEVARRRAQMLRRTSITIGAVVAAVALVLWAVNFFFPPDPQAVLLVNANAQIDQLVMEQQWAEALQVVEEAQTTLPDSPELLVWEGVLSEQVGDTERAQRSLERAQQLLPDNEVGFWLLVGNQRLQVGNIAGAEAAAQAALALAPDEPQATFLLGNVAETKGENAVAIDLFNQTFDLAETSNPQLAVIARVRMGNLLQRVDPLGGAATAITATGTLTTTVPVTP